MSERRSSAIRTIDDDRRCAVPGECENCGENNVLVRPVQAVGWLNEPRGYHSICFSCFAPRITWQRGEGGGIYVSPDYGGA